MRVITKNLSAVVRMAEEHVWLSLYHLLQQGGKVNVCNTVIIQILQC